MTRLAKYKLSIARHFRKEYTHRFKAFITVSDTKLYHIIQESIANYPDDNFNKDITFDELMVEMHNENEYLLNTVKNKIQAGEK